MARKKKSVKAVKEKISESVPKEKAVSKKSEAKTCRLADKNVIITLVVIAIVAAASWTAGSMLSGSSTSETDAGQQVVGQRVVNFLQSRLETNYPGIKVELSDVQDYENLSDTYQVNVNITYNGQSQEMPYYASKDGKSLFTIIGDLTEKFEAPPAQTNNQQNTGDVCSQLGVTKSDKPVMDVFIMSYCPYGLQMQKAVLPVMSLFGDKADIEIKWVYYSMHGKKEVDENTLQECIKKTFPEKYIAYAECFTATGTSDDCLTQAGITKSSLDSCISDLDTQYNITGLYNDKSSWLSGRYPLYSVYADENQKYGVGGSPTMVLNGKKVSVNRSPEAVKQALCCAFTNPPPECSQTLSSAAASPGIGGGTSGGTASTASCG